MYLYVHSLGMQLLHLVHHMHCHVHKHKTIIRQNWYVCVLT